MKAFTLLYSFWEVAKNSSFWSFLNSWVMASWNSATSTKWSPFNFIFNLVNRKWSGGDKSGQYMGWWRVATYFWVKNWEHLQLCGWAHYHATKKILTAERSWTNPMNALQEAIHYSCIKFCIYYFFPMVQILCALCLESWKNHQHGLDAGPLEFQFLWPRGCLTNPFRTFVTLFRVIGKTPGLISHNNFVKKIFVCIGHCDNVLARCDSIFPLLRCQGVWNKMCTQISLSQILFQNLKN